MNLNAYHTELSYNGFQRLVSDIWMEEGITLRQAYILAEDEHERIFSKTRYESFESFKANRAKYLKKGTQGYPSTSIKRKTFT